jgi:Type VII secretion system ESX-1, transport TM domain B
MTTTRTLAEAHAFSRRRLVTAFVSGRADGRELERPRPGRTMAGGAALGLLLLAGAVVSGVLAGRTEIDWHSPGLVISKDQGQSQLLGRESKPCPPPGHPDRFPASGLRFRDPARVSRDRSGRTGRA